MASATKRTGEDKSRQSESRGPVLEMLRKLLEGGRDDQVMKLVAQLLARNSELEKRLAKRRLSVNNESEGITTAQLELFLQALQEQANEALRAADEKLKNVAKTPEAPATPAKPAKQPALRRPIPDNLRRVENIIPVPDAQRPCPFCGKGNPSARGVVTARSGPWYSGRLRALRRRATSAA